MLVRARHFAALLIGATASLAVSAEAEESTATNTIRFKTYVRNDDGVVRCGIFSEKGWLKDPVRSATATPHGKVALCIFNGVPEGVFGISGFHDENKNGKLDTNLVGYPTEEYCASNNARNTFSAPSFSDAKFKYKGGTLELEARMK